jgi:flavorubredoxin
MRFVTVTVVDGETLALDDKTLRFVHTPWVHWPESMVTYLEEDRFLFSCNFFCAHIAASDLYVTDQGRVYEAAKRYFNEIMRPFRTIIAKRLDKLGSYSVDMIAPSHGEIYSQPAWILEAYRDWALDPPHNLVVLPFVSIHDSTRKMVTDLKVEMLEPVLSKGMPDQAAFLALEQLADAMAQKHRADGFQ